MIPATAPFRFPMPKIHQTRRYLIAHVVVFTTAAVSYLLWIAAMWRRDELHDNAWIYLAKLGSHGAITLMCWAFILATRFRPVEWLFGGLDKVYRGHRIVGESAFFLILLHPIFLAFARGAEAGGFFRYLWFSNDWARNTGIVAMAVFIVLVVLSIYWKIAYHRWKRTHDFFGMLLVLIVVHAVIAQGEIMRYPELAVWHGTWVVVALAAYIYIRVIYRFAGPQYDFATHGVQEIGDQITEVRLDPVGRPMDFQAGQFLYISFDSDAVSREPHPFSISSPPGTLPMRLSIKRLGDWTREIDRIRSGEPARVWGPYGHFSEILAKRPEMPAVLIGGGIGITPMLSIAGSDMLARRHGPSMLIYAVPDEASLVYDAELRARADAIPQLDYHSHLSDNEGFIDQAYLEKTLPLPLGEHLFLVCGPAPMMRAMRTLLQTAGVRPTRVIMEDFAIRD